MIIIGDQEGAFCKRNNLLYKNVFFPKKEGFFYNYVWPDLGTRSSFVNRDRRRRNGGAHISD